MVEFLNKQMDPAEILAVEVKQYVSDGLKTVVPRLMGQTAETRIKRALIQKSLDETTFFEHVDELEGIFYRKLLKFANENQLTTKWSAKSFSVNIEKNGTYINLLRAYCNLSTYGNALFVTAGSIKSNLADGENILKEYTGIEDFSRKVKDGYSLNMVDMDSEQTDRFYEVFVNHN